MLWLTPIALCWCQRWYGCCTADCCSVRARAAKTRPLPAGLRCCPTLLGTLQPVVGVVCACVYVFMCALTIPVATSRVEANELSALVQLVLRPFATVSMKEGFLTQQSDVTAIVASMNSLMMTVSRATGFLKLLGDMIRILGVNLRPWLHQFLAVVVRILQLSSKSVLTAQQQADADAEAEGDGSGDEDADALDETADNDDVDGELSTVVRGKQSLVLGKSIRGLCLQRLGGIIAQFPEYPYQPWLHVVYVPAPAWLCVLVLVCGCVGGCVSVCVRCLCVCQTS